MSAPCLTKSLSICKLPLKQAKWMGAKSSCWPYIFLLRSNLRISSLISLHYSSLLSSDLLEVAAICEWILLSYSKSVFLSNSTTFSTIISTCTVLLLQHATCNAVYPLVLWMYINTSMLHISSNTSCNSYSLPFSPKH
jgi:hypothetical protein